MTQAAKTKKIFDGRYEILSIVGRGARSVVYHARHVATPSSEVALKVLLDQKGKSTSGERLRKEALAMVSSRHKYVVRLDDFHSVGALCYLSMEFAPESDVRRYLKKFGGKLPVEVAERFLLQVAEALSFVHRAGIIHRDVKPDNILVMNEKEVRIADFGVAVLPGEEASLEDLQSGVGTMNYMAPEVLEGKGFDARSDIYSMGITFYELLSGINPFEKAPLAQQIEARQDSKIPSFASLGVEVPAYLESTIRQAVSFDRELRFPSAKEMVQSLLVNKSVGLTTKPETIAPKSAVVTEAATPTPAPVEKLEQAPSVATPPHTPPEPLPVQQKAAIENVPPPMSEAPPKEPVQPAQDNTFEPIQEVQESEIDSLSSEFEEKESEVNDLSVTDTSDDVEAAFGRPPSALDKVKQLVGKRTAMIDRATVERLRNGSLMQGLSGARPDLRRSITLAVSILFFLGLFLPGVRREINRYSIKYLKFDISKTFSSSPEIETASLPHVEGVAYVFPELPSGMYQGSITGLLPDKSFPLTFVSFADRDELAVLIGMEGWKATIVKPRSQVNGLPEEEPLKRLRVASNGFILNLTGQNEEGQLFGFFKNVVTGEEGQWSAEPVSQPNKET